MVLSGWHQGFGRERRFPTSHAIHANHVMCSSECQVESKLVFPEGFLNSQGSRQNGPVIVSLLIYTYLTPMTPMTWKALHPRWEAQYFNMVEDVTYLCRDPENAERFLSFV